MHVYLNLKGPYYPDVQVHISMLCLYCRGRQQADRGPDPDPDADLYGPGPIINTLIVEFNFDGAILF